MARIFFAMVALLLTAPARADLVSWEIDESQSEIELVVPDQVVDLDGLVTTIRLRNPSGGNDGPWNVGNVASVGGELLTNYEHGVSIQFLPVQLASGVASGSYRPNPASFDPLLANAE